MNFQKWELFSGSPGIITENVNLFSAWLGHLPKIFPAPRLLCKKFWLTPNLPGTELSETLLFPLLNLTLTLAAAHSAVKCHSYTLGLGKNLWSNALGRGIYFKLILIPRNVPGGHGQGRN